MVLFVHCFFLVTFRSASTSRSISFVLELKDEKKNGVLATKQREKAKEDNNNSSRTNRTAKRTNKEKRKTMTRESIKKARACTKAYFLQHSDCRSWAAHSIVRSANQNRKLNCKDDTSLQNILQSQTLSLLMKQRHALLAALASLLLLAISVLLNQKAQQRKERAAIIASNNHDCAIFQNNSSSIASRMSK